MTGLFSLAWALAADWLFGDPEGLPHPVCAVGRFIGWWDRLARKRLSGGERSAFRLRLAGLAGWCATVAGTFLFVWATVAAAGRLSAAAGFLVQTYWLFSGLAATCLSREAAAVAGFLRAGDLPSARRRLAGLVGRDTGELSSYQVVQAVVETVAENCSDGALAPIFWAALGAPFGLSAPAMWAYKAVNTMDSMVGYLDETHRDIGFVPAKADDVFNWIPARLAVILFALMAPSLGFDGAKTLRTGFEQGHRHLSPNAGYPEAAMAGALGITLGGTHTYGGMTVVKPELTGGTDEPNVRHIDMARSFLWPATLWAALLLSPLWLLP